MAEGSRGAALEEEEAKAANGSEEERGRDVEGEGLIRNPR